MKLIKLTAFTSILFSLFLTLNSCQNDDELAKTTVFAKTGIVLSGAQVSSTTNTSALGSMDVTYDRTTKTLNYNISWSGLASAPSGIGVYGPTPVSYPVNPTTPFQTISTTGLTASGSRSGSLLIDGVAIKEADLLNGLYSILIRTNASYPLGEIRGQIKFQ
jgi:hypothetical protein